MDGQVISLSGFKARAGFENDDTGQERVWETLERLCNILTSGGVRGSEERTKFCEDAIEALTRYIDNEWPVEKNNKIRATDLADRAAFLFVQSRFSATDMQSKLIDTLERDGFGHQRAQYTAFVENYVQAMVSTTPKMEP